MKRNGQVFVYLMLVATLAVSLLVPALAGAQPPAAGNEPYKVGFVNHLTGDMAPYGQSLKKGAELAVDQINAAGGVQGHPIEVIYEDDRGQAADAITAFTKLVETDKVPVVMGSASSTKTLAICPKAQESKVVLVSSVSTAPALKECGKYFFSMMVSDDAQGEEWVKIADYFKAKEAAVMYINNDYGNGVKDVFVKAFEKAGGKVLIAQPFEEGGKDFRTEVLKVKQAAPKVVFIVDHTAEGAIVLKQAKELQLNAQFVTDVSMVAKETLDGAGAAAEGVMGVRAASPTGPIWEKFKADFTAKFQTEPTIWADFAYDTMMMVAKAIEVGGYTADGIQQALFKVGATYVGPSGPKQLNEYGIAIGVFEWVTVKGGAWVAYENQPKAAPAAAAATGEPYKVGFVNHLTGDMAPYGQSLKKGAELAVDQINAAGGVQGHPIEVIYEDDRGQAADAITAFTKLVETDKVPVVMGSASSTKTLAICPKAQESKVVLVSSVSTAPALKECGKYFFSMMVSDDAQGEEWVKIADYFKAKEAAVMYINNDYGNGVKDVFVKAFEKAGGKVLIAQPFEEGGKDFRTEVLKVKQAAPKVVFIVDHTAEGAIVLKQAKELQLNAQFVTDVSMVAKETLDGAGAAAEGVMGVRAASPTGPIWEKFKADFTAKFQTEPTIWADFAYDTMMMVAKAIEVGGYTADGIQQALFKVGATYVGPSGPKQLNEYGIAIGVFEWVTVKDGAWVAYQKN